MKSILFITSTNLAANPRLVKELRLATTAGYATTVVQFRMGNWNDALTIQLQQEFLHTEFITLSALRSPFVPWLYSSLLQKLYNLLPVSFLSTKMLSVVTGKRSWLLLREIKKMRKSYDWVIAHNPAAFYPALVYAQRSGAKLGIDVEDYHPGETVLVKQQEQMLRLMQRVLPRALYCSYAAPLIAAETHKKIPGLTNKQLVLLNGFAANEFKEPNESESKRLKLVWFSQNIDAGRGLEEVLPAVTALQDKVELHLIGHLNPIFGEKYVRNRNGIVVHQPMPQQQLHAFLATCDVGLATDVPINRNREIALTNKILAYTQAGLFILTFPVEAQLDFLTSYQLQHRVMHNRYESILDVLALLATEDLSEKKMQQYAAGQQFDWLKLGKVLTATWEEEQHSV